MGVDYQAIVDGMTAMSCVVSVETLPDGGCGTIRLVCGNRAYVDSIEHPAPEMKMLKDRFVPNSVYTDYLTRDLNFEDFCYRAAVKGKCLHSYVHPDRMDIWFNMLFIPLCSDENGLSYCLYIMEVNLEADPQNMTGMGADMASAVLDTCIRLRGTSDFKATMKDVIKGIRELCDSEHCCILVMNEHLRSCYVLGEDFKEGSKLLPMETYVDDDFYDIAESWGATIAGSNCLIVKDEHDMEVVRERNPVWHESLTSAGAHSIVLFPLKSRNQLLGYMWAINFNSEKAHVIKETLEVTTFIIGSELGNYLLLDRLRLLSSKDLLTGVMNRNEMNNYVDKLCHTEEKDVRPVGVIFADLNGLKAINDNDGHNAGDQLLKDAAGVLKKVFDESCIFRAGGDEYAVIITDITQEKLDEKIADIRAAAGEFRDVFFALGGAVEKDSRNVRMALRRADENMYEDKRLFYEQNPDKVEENLVGRGRSEEMDEKFRERSLYHEMNYDHLTGLPSMTYFFKLAEAGRAEMHDNDIPSALLFLNFNGMRYYNQKFGFAEGDELIKEFADIIADVFGRENCTRFGQDHFAVYTEAKDIEKKLKKVFRNTKTAKNGRSLPLKVGIYLDEMGLVETSLACDRAKFASSIIKDENNSYFNYFDSRMLASEINRQYIVENIDRAINENWIKAFYQPIVRSTNRRVCDEEALARWIDPEKGMLSPGEFIPILEDTRLIYKVDLHIVDIILERMKKQREKGLDVVPISVNLSRTDFEACNIVEEIKNRVDTAGVARDMITIEITESVVGGNFDFMKEQITRFQNYGFKVWMDDFGSGYSSLDLLQEMQFDLIKFDMRFMRQFDSSPRSRVILTELMRMAQSLGIETVCEGVETAQQASFLSEIGCTKMQGYFFSKPIPVEEIWDRYDKGIQIGFENPDEADYHKIISSINLYDLRSVSIEESESSIHYFDSMPMAIVEYDSTAMKIVRCNKTYREFVSRFLEMESVGSREDMADVARKNTGSGFASALRRCSEGEHKVFLSETMEDGSTVHSMIKRIAENPVTGTAAYAIAVLDIVPEDGETTYSKITAILGDFIAIYMVDPENGNYMQYSASREFDELGTTKAGLDFYEDAVREYEGFMLPEDREYFRSGFSKDQIMDKTRKGEIYKIHYRLMLGGKPVRVSLRAGLVQEKSGPQLIVGISKSVPGDET